MSTETKRAPAEAPKATMSLKVPLAEGAKLRLEGDQVVAEGKLGKASRRFPVGALGLTIRGSEATLSLYLPVRKRSRALLLTWERHLGNLARGVTVGFEAHLKAVSAHFPMKISSRDGQVLIENFLNEKQPRRSKLLGKTVAEVAGDIVVLKGIDIEDVGQSAANLERATKIRNYDPRVFQDGVFITDKARPREA
jgi:large subunit ribosomal protein L6